MAIEMRGVCPLIQVFDMPTSVRFIAMCWGSKWRSMRRCGGRTNLLVPASA